MPIAFSTQQHMSVEHVVGGDNPSPADFSVLCAQGGWLVIRVPNCVTLLQLEVVFLSSLFCTITISFILFP